MKNRFTYVVFVCLLLVLKLQAQNENKKWYFGNFAGLDFMTIPPTAISGSMNTTEGCASVADAAGNLLFYTNGITIWNSSHIPMANGTGLTGNGSTTQSAVIVKKPGSATIYYVFTKAVNCSGLSYSIVDMSLAAGSGSVTNQNIFVVGNVTEKLTSVKHCNGTDVWVLVSDCTNPTFHAYLVSATGVNTVAVTSTVTASSGIIGYMKFSPNGKKLAFCNYSSSTHVADFDANTGIVSNAFTLPTGAYGCEFSPDGTKLYTALTFQIKQWDLCAGTATAVAASLHVITSLSGNWALQLGTDGKIYAVHGSQQFLGVINNPNVPGVGCNYVDNGQSISPHTGLLGLPNFITSGFKPPPVPFTHTVSNTFGCQTASFTAPPIAQNFTVIGCAASGYSLTGLQWNFGDPASGAGNISGLVNPSHAFTSLGTYTTQLILYYSCGGGTDTIRQVVNINQPCITVSSTSITCASLGSATVQATGGIGPFSYTWMPSGQTNSVATGLSPGTYTLTVFDFGNNFTYTATTLFTSLIPLSGNIAYSSSVSCNGAATGTGAVTGLSGGSGSQFYLWTNGVTSYSTSSVNSLYSGIWNVSVVDALTGCSIGQPFYVAQPAPMVLVVSASSPSTCAGTAISFTATNFGGTPGPGPGYTYSWTAGPSTNTYTALETLAGNYIFTVNSTDANTCTVSNTISVDFVPNPTLTVSSSSICPLETGLISANGGVTYTWNPFTPLSSTGTTFTDNPLATTQYTVIGTALSCTSMATGSIVLKPVPSPIFTSNSPICNGQSLVFSSTSATAAIWTGALGFNSSTISNTITPSTPSHSGVYQVTVTAGNSCTASTSGTVVVNPTPSLSSIGSTVCVNQTVTLSAGSVAGVSYLWTGPAGLFTSTLQSPSIANPQVAISGNYTVKATSVDGCTNTSVAHVTVTALPVITFTSNSPQCFGNTLSFNTQGTTGANLYSWLGPNGFFSTLQHPSLPNVTVPASGNYTLTVTTGPCVVSASQSATVHPLPTPQAQNNGPVCQGKEVQISVNNSGVVYQWSGPSFSSQQQSFSISNVNSGQGGTYQVLVTDGNGCQATSVTSVTVLENPIVNATGDMVCFGEPAQLNATGASGYYWSGPNSFTATGSNPQVNPTINTQVWTYVVVGTAVNGCTAVSTTTVGTRVLPVASLTAPQRVCIKSTIQLQGQGGIGYQWTGPLNYVSNQQNPVFTALNVGMGGTYSLMVSDGFGCKGYTSTVISIDPEPAGELRGTKLEACVPFCSSYSLQSIGTSSIINSVWQIGTQTFTTATFSYCFTKAGDYRLEGKFENERNCKASIEFVVRGFPQPEANFTYLPLAPIENQEQVVFTNTSAGDYQSVWHWAFHTAGSYTANGQSTAYLFEEAGIYAIALQVENRWGCSDTVIKTVEVLPDYHVYIPNAFTPNGDGLNDVFFAVMRGVKTYSMQVFDRWGELIFSSSDPTRTWDGSFKGEPCKSDVYNFKITTLSNKGDEKVYIGQMQLLR